MTHWILAIYRRNVPCPTLAGSREAMLVGTVLGTIEKTLDLSEPGMSAPLDAYLGEERFAHPAIILRSPTKFWLETIFSAPGFIHRARSAI